ncbi:MAG: 4'-phosphopantetheinyl transferase superfamily protein [Oligoflexia bacterium]|nr:4'-phosphopantetheinyl transferase superfamily protein [Oligoflexia bacterium]
MTLYRSQPFDVCVRDARHHGVVVGVTLPDSPDPVPDRVLTRLLPAERDHALTLRGYRQTQWVGGRLAAHRAFRILGCDPVALLTDAHGAPQAQTETPLAVSLAHKNTLAVALVARAEHGDIGVDLEDQAPARMRVAERVLTPSELSDVAALAQDRQWTAVVLRFSLKEAIYKALAPRLQRYIDFSEATVDPHPDGTVTVALNLAKGENPPDIEARFTWLPGRVLSTVRARWS